MMSDTIDPDTGEISARPEPGTMNLIGLLMAAGNGDFVADCNHEMTHLVAKMKEILVNENRDVKGQLQITIKWSNKGPALVYAAECATKAPGPRPIQGLVFADEEGNLFRNDPEQVRMSFGDRTSAFKRGKK
jgi:hypothetical protein